MIKKHLFSAVKAAAIVLTMATASSCQNSTPSDLPSPALDAIWVVSEGNFGASNAKITAYDPQTKKTTEDIFTRANDGAALGDSPTAVQLFENQAYITISNSAKIYILNPKTAVLEGKITDLGSPRHIAFVSKDKAYVSDLYAKSLTIINPSTMTVTGQMNLGSSVEQFVQHGSRIFANQWSFGQQLIQIDPATDKVVDSIKVGVQPNCILKDVNNNFWTLCDGGYEGNPLGYVAPTIVRVVNLGGKMAIGNEFTLPKGLTYSCRLAINGSGTILYYILADKLYSMPIDATSLPIEPIATIEKASFYSLAVNPYNGEVYCGDAVDFQQAGTIYRFDAQGKLLDKFSAGGVSPSSYLF